MRCGLIGKTLGHSFSPEIHKTFGRYEYDLVSLSEEELPIFLEESFKKQGKYAGMNVTIPYKQAVIPFCQELSPEAKAIGSVNTLVRDENGRLKGYNTDAYGMLYLIKKSGIEVAGRKAIVLGTGGTSLTASYVLKTLGAASVTCVSRKGPVTYENADRGAEIIINTTPVGMFPSNGQTPLDISEYKECIGVVDAIFNPLTTSLVQQARERGIPAVNGLAMLVAQAKQSGEYFSGALIEDEIIDEIYETLLSKCRNIVLTGMPGCGKTHVGMKIAKKTGRKFIDMDAAIEKEAGCVISQIFDEQGEKAFRDLETQIASKIGKETAAVISTGGGTLLRRENRIFLKQNGTFYFIERDLDKLPVKGRRPLSTDRSTLEKMYKQRLPIYLSSADAVIKNTDKIEETVEEIIRLHGAHATEEKLEK